MALLPKWAGIGAVAVLGWMFTSSCAVMADAPCEPPAVGTLRQWPVRGFVRVASFNVYWGARHRQARLEQTGEVLRRLDADVIALQEVARWWGDEQQPSDCWASRLEVGSFHRWLERGLFFSQGLALMSRFPVEGARLHAFTRNRAFNVKGLVHGRVQTSMGPLHVVNVHLAATLASDAKRAQWQELSAHVLEARKEAPVVVLGDFNEPPEAEAFSRFLTQFSARHLHAEQPGPLGLKTWSGGYGAPCDSEEAELIDNVVVIAGGPNDIAPRIVAGGIVSLSKPYASDHCPVVADLAWP